MLLAFILINANLGTEEELVKELKTIKEVKEAYFVYGPYDIITKIQVDTSGRLRDVVTNIIRRLGQVNYP